MHSGGLVIDPEKSCNFILLLVGGKPVHCHQEVEFIQLMDLCCRSLSCLEIPKDGTAGPCWSNAVGSPKAFDVLGSSCLSLLLHLKAHKFKATLEHLIDGYVVDDHSVVGMNQQVVIVVW